MELIDIRWCLASGIRRAQRFMEITGQQCLEGSNTKMGFNKSKVTCFRCKQKGHFKREYVNREVADHVNPFHDDYYKKAIYHRNNEQMTRINQKQIEEESSTERKHAAHVTIHGDEGFDWSKYIPEEDTRALVAVVKEKTKEEILEQKTYRERFVDYRIDEMQKGYDEARRMGRWDKKRECYANHNGEPVVDSSLVVYNGVLVVIPSVW
ncbi:putative transcription factor interactor and regulator CCHC(Zn) family [Helianthus debilis subsp. tardiflorus]